MRRSLFLVVGGLVTAPLLAVAVGAGFGAAFGWSVLLGLVLPLVFFGITVVVALATATAPAGRLGAIVLLTWLSKIAALLVALYWLRGQDFFHRPTFLAVFLVATAGVLVLEGLFVVRSRTLYVDL